MRFSQALGSAGWVAGGVSPPAIWGKLPSHADYITHGVRADEVEALQTWFSVQRRSASRSSGRTNGPRRTGANRWVSLEPETYKPSRHNIPICFVLPPGELPFSGPAHVLGVIANSCDRLGRQHPLIVYQRANARWLRQHFASEIKSDFQDAEMPSVLQLQLEQPWSFWLARLVSRYARPSDDAASLELTQVDETPGARPVEPSRSLYGAVTDLWSLHAPTWSRWAGIDKRPPPAAALQAVIESAGAPRDHDRANDLRGVACSPWADWPDRLWSGKPAPAFWQQDSYGGYVGAAQRLGELWER